jgi:hypothetical protein
LAAVALTACFVSASRQNVFFGELQDALAEALEGQGVAVERAVDCFPPPRAGMAYVFVPHEFLPLVLDDAHPDESQLRRSVAICTEQPGTHWFEEAAQAAVRASCAVDINRLGVEALCEREVDARLLQLGYTPRWDRWHAEAGSPRTTELALLAGATPRRLAAVARCGRHLAGRRTQLHMPEALVPHDARSERFISGEQKWSLLARTELLLNVHRGELGYFEWQRAVEAIVNGAVLLSEHSLGFEPLVPGEHFISASYASLDVALEGLLEDRDRLTRIRRSAYELLREHHPLSASIGVLCEALDDAARSPLPARRRALASDALAKPPQLPPPAWELLEPAASAQPAGSSERPAREDDGRAAPHDAPTAERSQRAQHEWFGTREERPRVTALLDVASGPADAAAVIEGIALSESCEELELLLVDRSGNRSCGEALRRTLRAAPWLSGRLITLPDSTGAGAARNRAAELASGELLLLVEAATVPYPHAARSLVRALEGASGASFAYGPVEVHPFERAERLEGYLGWEPYRLRYGPFIGGIALVRRVALAEAGGFTTDPRLEGWEDFALWCALADRARRGIRLPEILASKRPAPERTAARSEPAVAWRVLRERYACLSAPFSG